jgi:ABC-type branched-subunit amino acid transport system substrate-binding protein
LRRALLPAAWLALALLAAACETVPEPLPRVQPAPPPAAEAAPPPAPPVMAAPVEAAPVPPAEPAAPAPVLIPPTGAAAARVALLVPLSGPSAPVGRAILEAAQLALFDQEEARLTLLPRDTTGTPEGALAAAQAVLAEGAGLILGPLFAADVAAIAPIARERGVAVIAFSTDRTVAGDGVYLIGLTPGEQVARVVGFARSRGLARFAVLAPDTPYGATVTAALEQSLQRFGGELVRAGTYPAESADLTPVVRGFARGERGFDAVLLPEGGARLRAVAPLLPYYDIDPKTVRFLGTGLWDDPTIGSEPALVGGWFAAPPPQENGAFQKRFEETYGRRPVRVASLGYDAVALAAALQRIAPRDPFGRAALANADGFAGYNGIFRFRPDGTAERGLAVIEVQARSFRVIDPAPASFEVPTN